MIYADDTQVYVVLNGDYTCKSAAISKLELCVKDIKAWSTANYITLTLLRGWWGRCEKNYLRKEEGREGGEKKRAQRARRTWGSNPGPAAC